MYKRVYIGTKRFGVGLLVTLLACNTLALCFLPARTDALAGADFHPGRIIDNAIFYNSGAMTADQIQGFLNGKVPTCDTNGTTMYSSGQTRAQYGQTQGHPAPYTCLKDYKQNPTTGADNYGGKPVPDGAKSAAQIIYDAAQTYNLNPQVILVTLQKESSIVTDDWPWDSQYKTAMGYACPDNGPNFSANCNATYFGFSNQVINAAQQFRRYATNPNNYNFLPGINNSIQYNPNSSCGESQVYIENQATASLYNYTPYQPNTQALNNLFGTGNSCSAYGNRNFWRIFNLWFGSTQTNERGLSLGEAQNRIYPIEFKGDLYVFYYDAFRRALRMAYNDPTDGWQFSIVDGESTPGNGSRDASVGSSIALTVFNNKLQLFYYDKTNGNLRYGTYDGTAWNFLNLDGDPGSMGHRDANIGTNPSVVAYNGTMQLFYYDQDAGNLRHAWYDTQNWRFEDLDGDPNSVTGQNGFVGAFSTVTAYNGTMQLFYYDAQNARLRHAWISQNVGWRFENFDGLSGISQYNGQVGISPVATPVGDALQLFYYDEARSNVRHAWTTSMHGWKFEDLDGDGNTAVSKSLRDVGLTISATVQNNQLHLFYYDKTYTNLRHAWAAPDGWKFDNIDGDPGSMGGLESDSGIHSGVTTFWGGTALQLFYYNRTTGNFRHAWTDATGWRFENFGPAVIY